MSTLCQLPKEPTSNSAGCGDAASTTKVVHTPADAHQPAITLTTYQQRDSDASAPRKSLLRPVKPIDPSPYAAPKRSTLDKREPELVQLKRELEEYWRGLKSEFEEKTGRSWVPLKAWEKEEWEWDGEEEEKGDGEDEDEDEEAGDGEDV